MLFRSVDTSILEGNTITVKYKFTVLNAGEVDRTGKLATMTYSSDTNDLANVPERLSNKFKTFKKEGNKLVNETKPGEYLGTIYYYGENRELFDYNDDSTIEEDYIVTSRVRQLVDYVDNDVVFDQSLNDTANMSWSTITTEKLLNNHIDSTIAQSMKILDEDEISYETDDRHNLATSVDYSTANQENLDETVTLNNSGFIVDLQPKDAYDEDRSVPYQASMYLTVTQTIGADSDDLKVDSVAEILRYNNKVGRRDELTIAGNQNPAEVSKGSRPTHGREMKEVSDTFVYERDTSATEVITLSPPTGSSREVWRAQVMTAITVGLAIVAGGIVWIKKKIVK